MLLWRVQQKRETEDSCLVLVMRHVAAQLEHPQIWELLANPHFLAALMDPNFLAALANQAFLDKLKDPKFLALLIDPKIWAGTWVLN